MDVLDCYKIEYVKSNYGKEQNEIIFVLTKVTT